MSSIFAALTTIVVLLILRSSGVHVSMTLAILVGVLCGLVAAMVEIGGRR